MSGLKGDISKLRRLEQSIRQLPRVVAQKVAERSASTITSLARGTFAAGENAYGDSWEPGAEGQRVTLHKSGALGRFQYVAIGTRLRAQLGPRYSKYQTGKRPVFPGNGARLPVAYVDALQAVAREAFQECLLSALVGGNG